MPNTRFSQLLLPLKINKNPEPQEHAQHRSLGRKNFVQTLGDAKNNKEKDSSVKEKPETKNV